MIIFVKTDNMTEQEKIELAAKRGYCKEHKPNFGNDYIDWYNWNQLQHKQGLKQTKCEKCGYWYWPSEF